MENAIKTESSQQKQRVLYYGDRNEIKVFQNFTKTIYEYLFILHLFSIPINIELHAHYFDIQIWNP